VLSLSYQSKNLVTMGCKPSKTTSGLPSSQEQPYIGRDERRMESLPEHLRYGLTLPGMRGLLKKLPSDACDIVNNQIEKDESGKPKYPLNHEINGYVNQYFIAKWGEEDNLTVCERLKNENSVHVGQANVFVSWSLSTPIKTLLNALNGYLQQHNDLEENDTFFWVCDYVIQQNDVATDLKRLKDCVEGINRTVLLLEPWDAPEPLKRAHCIKEVYHTQRSEATFEVVMSTEQQKSFDNALLFDFQSIVSAMSKVDIKEAKCRNPKDQKAILDELNNDVGYSKCNKLVIGLLHDALVSKGDKGLDRMSKIERKKEESLVLLNNLGMLHKVQGNHKRAHSLYEEAISVGRETFESKQATLIFLNNLGLLHQEEGNYKKARPLYEEATSGLRETLGSEHPNTLLSINNLGVLHGYQGNYAEACLLLEEVLSSRQESLGSNHPDTLKSLESLGLLHQKQGNYEKARLLLEEPPSDHRVANQGNDTEAPPSGHWVTFESNHPNTMQSINTLKLWHKDQENDQEAHLLLEEGEISC